MNYISNTKFLMLEKIIRLFLSFGMTIWLANYLGPSDFGLFNYALSFVMLFSVFSSSALDKLIPKDVVMYNEKEELIVSTTLRLRLIGSFLMIMLSMLIIYLYKPNDKLLIMMVFILSTGFIFKSFEVIKFWFEAKVKSLYSSIAQTIALVLSTLIKIYLIYFNYPVEYFAMAIAMEYLFLSVLLLYMYNKFVKLKTLFDNSYIEMKRILINAFPLILASALYTVYTKIDQIMIENIISIEAVGLYAAATKISEGWFFIPAIIATSFYPAILASKKNGNIVQYKKRIQHLLNIMVLISVIVGIGITIISEELINFLYSESYSSSYLVLIIHIWGGLFVAMSGIVYRVLIAEDLQKYSFYRGLVGLFVNIGLNYILIPKYGIIGAAVATLVSQFFALYLFNITNEKTRNIFYMQTKAFNPMEITKTLSYLKEMRIKK